MAGRGGKRPGSGRPKGTVKRVIHQTSIQAAEGKIRDRLPWLVDKMLELADGVEIERTDRQGQRRIYSEPPDREAIKYLMDRVMGKAVQPVSLVDEVRALAAREGFSDEETAEAVAEAERVVQGAAGARG